MVAVGFILSLLCGVDRSYTAGACRIDGPDQSCSQRSLTLRNRLIGCHIEEYERSGKDRADYGERLMDALASEMTAMGVSRCDRRELYRYRKLYLTYPQIVEAQTPQFSTCFHLPVDLGDSVSQIAPAAAAVYRCADSAGAA